MQDKNEKRIALRPKRSLGQNFLRDENIARKIIAALQVSSSDAILEIGAGTGVLTKYLLDSAVKVIAVEIDERLTEQLKQQFNNRDNLVLLNEDILKLDWESIIDKNFQWKLIGNLPYHITSQVFFKLFDTHDLFQQAIFMVQKEVALRIIAKSDCKDYGILSVFSQFYAEPEKLFDVSHHVFFPKPDVTSAVIRLKMKKNLPLKGKELEIFRLLVKKSFSQRRKMLRNSLKEILRSHQKDELAGFDFERRPEQLRVEEFVELARRIAGLQFKK